MEVFEYVLLPLNPPARAHCCLTGGRVCDKNGDPQPKCARGWWSATLLCYLTCVAWRAGSWIRTGAVGAFENVGFGERFLHSVKESILVEALGEFLVRDKRNRFEKLKELAYSGTKAMFSRYDFRKSTRKSCFYVIPRTTPSVTPATGLCIIW